MRRFLASREAALAVRLALAIAALGLWTAPYAQKTPTLPQQAELDRTKRETKQELDKIDAARTRRSNEEWARRSAGPDFESYGSGDNRYSPSSNASRGLGRSAPPPPGVEWIVKAQQAWQQNRDSDAADYLRRASEAGSAGATRILGVSFEEGIGVPQDPAAAVHLYRKAASMGDDDALLHLGRTYALGIGVPMSYAQSIEWYTKASRRASTRDRGEKGLAAVRELESVDRQLESVERQIAEEKCNATGDCNDARKPPEAMTASAQGPAHSPPLANAPAPAAPAAPPSWTKIAANGGIEYYVDWSSLTRRDGVLQVAELWSFTTPKTDASGKLISSVRSRREYDCRRDTARILQAQAFGGALAQGDTVFTVSQPTLPTPPTPNSPASVLQVSVCARQ
jgi:Sel1 repeat